VPLLRQVEVAEGLPTDEDGDPEEGVHLGVVRGEADGGRVPAQVGDPQRVGLGDQLAEHALALRQGTHPGGQVVVDAHVDEGRQPALGRQHAQRAVPGVDQLGARLDDAPQRGLQVQPGRDGEEGVEQVLDAGLALGHGRQAFLDLLQQLGEAHAGQGRARRPAVRPAIVLRGHHGRATSTASLARGHRHGNPVGPVPVGAHAPRSSVRHPLSNPIRTAT
jgi:hypothetical protein